MQRQWSAPAGAENLPCRIQKTRATMLTASCCYERGLPLLHINGSA